MTLLILCLSLLAAAAPPAHALTAEEDLFAEAESRYLAKNYTAALEAYEGFLSAYPLSARVPDIQYRRAVCLYRTGQFGAAVKSLGEVERKYRSTRYFQFVPFWKGLSMYELGSYSLAVEGLDAFLAGPKDAEFTPQALLHKALSHIGLSNEKDAMGALNTLRTDFPGSRFLPYATVLLGSILQREGSFAELLDLAAKTDSSGFPEKWRTELTLLRAEALWNTGRADEAVPLYGQLVGADEEIALISYRRLFDAAQRKEDLQEMRDLTQAAEARFAGRAAVLSELWARVGAESYRKGKGEAAEPFLRRAWNVRREQPVMEVVPLYMAEVLLARGERDAARSILEEYVASGAKSTGAAVIRLGDIALQMDEYAVAAGYYSRFRASFPNSRRASEAGYLLAFCEFRQGLIEDSSRLAEELLRQPLDPALHQQLAKLRIVLLRKAQRMADAAAALREYEMEYPGDVRSRVDLLKTLFILKQNDSIVREADGIRRQFPGIDKDDPYSSLIVSYLRGLALIARKEYGGAIADLGSIQRASAEKASLEVIYPYARYYLGWAYVKTASFDRAAQVFDGLASSFATHELASNVRYLAGWAHFSAGEYDKASGYFSTLAGGGDLGQKSQYLYAKCLLNMKRTEDAVGVLLAIDAASPASPWADQALFDYAGILADKGETRSAVEAYARLAAMFPESSLREEAFYKQGEVLFANGAWAAARTAFDEYRRKFPKGRLVDAALFWGGGAAEQAGEGKAAALLWEQLIAGSSESPFRGEGLRKTAEVYAQSREYAKSLQLYTRFIAEYPEEARAARADIRAEQVRYQSEGFGDREAELSAVIARETGAKKREATIELARLYIYSGEKRAETGYRSLLAVIAEG
jgi:TolA-binding protein